MPGFSRLAASLRWLKPLTLAHSLCRTALCAQGEGAWSSWCAAECALADVILCQTAFKPYSVHSAAPRPSARQPRVCHLPGDSVTMQWTSLLQRGNAVLHCCYNILLGGCGTLPILAPGSHPVRADPPRGQAARLG